MSDLGRCPVPLRGEFLWRVSLLVAATMIAALESIDKNNDDIASGAKDEASTQRPTTASSPRISSLQSKMKVI